MGKCGNCQEVLDEEWKICPYCGESTSTQQGGNTSSHRQQDIRGSSSSQTDVSNRESAPNKRSPSPTADEHNRSSSGSPSSSSQSAQQQTEESSTSKAGNEIQSRETESSYSFSSRREPGDSNQSANQSKNRTSSESSSREPGANEAYCSSCGEVIKAAAEVCPHCGVEQLKDNTSDLPQSREFELQQIARQSTGTIGIVGLIFPPAAYFMVNKIGLAVICLLSANFFLLGHIITPFHARGIVKSARQQLEGAGSNW